MTELLPRSLGNMKRAIQLCDLILNGEGSKYFQWLSDLSAALKDAVSTPANITFGYTPGGRGNRSAHGNSLHQLLTLLRKCLLEIRYEEGLSVLKAIIKNCRSNIPLALEVPLYRGGLEIMYSGSDGYKRVISQFTNHLKFLRAELNTQQVVLEYFLYLMSLGDTHEAKDALTTIPKVGKTIAVTQQGKYIEKLIQAYRGLFSYIEWYETEKEISNLSESPQLFGLREKSQLLADRAISEFESLEGVPGVWDIFVCKHVEVLHNFRRTSEARKVLENYRNSNMDNPNAHIYLYDFCLENGSIDKEELLKLLTEFNERWPSNKSHALALIRMLSTESQLDKRTTIYFNLLDYSCHMEDAELWSEFEAFLALNVNSEMVRREWLTRQSWWPAYLRDSHSPVSNAHISQRNILNLLCKHRK